MSTSRLTPTQARRLPLACQGLDGRWNLPRGKEGAAQVVERLGYVQIDTIAVVERAHHHTLWARCPDYEPAQLDQLLRERQVFEYWAHAASYLPMSDFRFYFQEMQWYGQSEEVRRWRRNNRKLVDEVLKRIRDEGPLRSADFDSPTKRRGSWWHWKPAKQVLERLFNAGELMVTERRNFQRVYDLRERVLPPEVDLTPPSAEERAAFSVRRALATGALVVDLPNWRVDTHSAEAREVLEALVDSGEATAFRVRGWEEPGYVLTESLAAIRRRSKRLHLLCPFDNLLIDRRRTRQLFDFDYKLECYTPAAKRRWGYFCLPLLWGVEFIGRLDAKADRKAQTLIVKKLMFEPDFAAHQRALPALAKKLKQFAAFNRCGSLKIEETDPNKMRAPLRRELNR